MRSCEAAIGTSGPTTLFQRRRKAIYSKYVPRRPVNDPCPDIAYARVGPVPGRDEALVPKVAAYQCVLIRWQLSLAGDREVTWERCVAFATTGQLGFEIHRLVRSEEASFA